MCQIQFYVHLICVDWIFAVILNGSEHVILTAHHLFQRKADNKTFNKSIHILIGVAHLSIKMYSCDSLLNLSEIQDSSFETYILALILGRKNRNSSKQ